MKPHALWALLILCSSHQGYAKNTLYSSVDIVSRYIYRGFDANHQDPALQMSFTFVPSPAPNLWLNTWMSTGLYGDSESMDYDSFALDEIDFLAGYSFILHDRVTLQPQFGFYSYLTDFSSLDGQNSMDMEAGIKLSIKIPGDLFFDTFYARGIDEGIQGNYVAVGLKREFSFKKYNFALTPQVSGGLTSEYGFENEFTELVIGLPFRWNSQSIALRSNIEFHWIPNAMTFGSEDKYPLTFAVGFSHTL